MPQRITNAFPPLSPKVSQPTRVTLNRSRLAIKENSVEKDVWNQQVLRGDTKKKSKLTSTYGLEDFELKKISSGKTEELTRGGLKHEIYLNIQCIDLDEVTSREQICTALKE